MMRRLQSVAGCISLLAVLLGAGPALAECEGVPGDLTQNGVVDVVDAMFLLTALSSRFRFGSGLLDCSRSGQWPGDLLLGINVVDVL